MTECPVFELQTHDLTAVGTGGWRLGWCCSGWQNCAALHFLASMFLPWPSCHRDCAHIPFDLQREVCQHGQLLVLQPMSSQHAKAEDSPSEDPAGLFAFKPAPSDCVAMVAGDCKSAFLECKA